MDFRFGNRPPRNIEEKPDYPIFMSDEELTKAHPLQEVTEPPRVDTLFPEEMIIARLSLPIQYKVLFTKMEALEGSLEYFMMDKNPSWRIVPRDMQAVDINKYHFLLTANDAEKFCQEAYRIPAVRDDATLESLFSKLSDNCILIKLYCPHCNECHGIGACLTATALIRCFDSIKGKFDIDKLEWFLVPQMDLALLPFIGAINGNALIAQLPTIRTVDISTIKELPAPKTDEMIVASYDPTIYFACFTQEAITEVMKVVEHFTEEPLILNWYIGKKVAIETPLEAFTHLLTHMLEDYVKGHTHSDPVN